MTTLNQKFAQLQPFSLYGSGVVLGSTSITLTSFLDINGNQLTMASFGTLGWGTLEPGNGNLEEQISFTGVTQNTNGTATLTGVSSVGFIYPYTSTSGLLKTHAGATSFIISNTAGFYAELASTADDEVITGLWTFPNGANNPVIGTTYIAPTLPLQIPTKEYVDGVAIAGAPNATTTQAGIVLLSVNPVSGTGIAVTTNDTRVSPVSLATLTAGEVAALPGDNADVAVGAGNTYVTQTGLIHNAEKYSVDTGTSTGYVLTLAPVVTSLTDGMVVYGKMVHANTTTTPTLNVNSLGAKTIVKRDNQALVNGDIGTAMYTSFAYNFSGSTWVMQTPVVHTTTATNPSRSLGTWYQNTTGEVVFVTTSVLSASSSNTSGFSLATALINPTSGTTFGAINAGQVGFNSNGGDFANAGYAVFSVSFAVPNNSYYEVVATGSISAAPTLVYWSEYVLQL